MKYKFLIIKILLISLFFPLLGCGLFESGSSADTKESCQENAYGSLIFYMSAGCAEPGLNPKPDGSGYKDDPAICASYISSFLILMDRCDSK